MHLGIILETNDPERVWNAFRLANTALDADHTVAVFPLGDGVEASEDGLGLRSAMADRLRIVEDSEKILTVG